MEEITTSSSIITEVLLKEYYSCWSNPFAILVHTSIINKVANTLHKKFPNAGWEMCEHILKIGSERFEMHVITVLRQVMEKQPFFLRNLVIESQFSFPWEENPTLFIAVAEIHIMETFIKHFNLTAFIVQIELKLAHSVNGDHTIIVVSFNQSVNAKLDIIEEFKNYLFLCENEGYLFVTNGFPWQEFNLMRRIRLNDNMYSVLPIILRHLGTLNYANDLNIMDLLSLRLAISDVCDPSYPNLLSYEIDFLIKRILARLIKNNHLSIRKYFIVRNIKPTRFFIAYLVYEFQHLFQTLDINFTDYFIKTKPFPLRDTIKLKEEIDVLNKLKKTFNVNYCIDGMDFDNMSLSLFVDLIELQNVCEIVLDTNYRWCNDVFRSENDRIIPGYKEDRVNIYLRGENTFNFIEGFTTELKTITLDNRNIILNINCNLNDYRIFDNLKDINIIFRDIKIDFNVLQNLKQCAIEPLISLRECSLESTSRNWELLNNLERLDVTIYEDEGTWLSMFEFTVEEMHKSNRSEFQFNRKGAFEILMEPLLNPINLNLIKFAVDEHNSKLEIRCIKTNEVIDLYCEKLGIDQGDKSDYEFYQ